MTLDELQTVCFWPITAFMHTCGTHSSYNCQADEHCLFFFTVQTTNHFLDLLFGCFCCRNMHHKMHLYLFSSFCSVAIWLFLSPLAPSPISVGQLSYTLPQCSHPSLRFIVSPSPHLLLSTHPLLIPCTNQSCATSQTSSHSMHVRTHAHMQG